MTKYSRAVQWWLTLGLTAAATTNSTTPASWWSSNTTAPPPAPHLQHFQHQLELFKTELAADGEDDTAEETDGVMAERDYDFYAEDSEGSESGLMTVKAGYYPAATDRQDSEYYDDEYDDYTPQTRDGHGGGQHGGGGGYDSGHGGGGGYGHSHGGYKVQPRKPGPFGYPTPNFKCEKSSETLYVTETELTYDKKCYNVYKVQCKDGYDEGKGIGYQKHCNEFTGLCLSLG